MTPERAEYDYEAEIRKRMVALIEERPGETNWIGYVMAGHEPGECPECDALRRLEIMVTEGLGS